VAEFTKTVAEFTKIAFEGVLLLQEWKIFCIFAMSFSTQDNKKVCKMKNKWQYDTITAMAHR